MAHSPLTDHDLHLFNEGTHYQLYNKLGGHLTEVDGKAGAWFAVWAPNAERVTVVGDFNSWSIDDTPLKPRGSSGIWEGFVEGAKQGDIYKYRIQSKHNGYVVMKADPYGHHHETPPRTGSVLWPTDYTWSDDAWMQSRKTHNALNAPMSIYEVHLGSWARVPEDGNRSLSYRELAPRLIDHVKRLGFTHVELLPIMEHPFEGSWGYQVTGFFAPTSRFGTPQDFMFLVDSLHQAGIGVILDWVPGHFPTDEHGLGYFDGTHLYEHEDPRRGFHPDWTTYIFNYGRHEVRAFLISSAMVWLDRYHIDGIRVDGVASMLYLDYSREEGEWLPNEHGGRENVDAIEFLRRFNEEAYGRFPDAQTFAEESTSWPMVSRPTYIGGLGFGMKWDMGWMHDTLEYFKRDPMYRAHHHNELTFRSLYAFHENFVMPLSHDEVVHGKGSLWGRMPGDEWQKLANMRLLMAYQWGLPGKKLLFMGQEVGQVPEWNHESSVEWHLLDVPNRHGLLRLFPALNGLYAEHRAMHGWEFRPEGFEWICGDDAQNSVLIFMRRCEGDRVVCAYNFTPATLRDYRIGMPEAGEWVEVLNTDAETFGGSNQVNEHPVRTEALAWQGRPQSACVTLPPLGAVFFKLTS